MINKQFSLADKVGLPPGALIHIGKDFNQPLKLEVIEYNTEIFNVYNPDKVEDCFSYRDSKITSWINVTGLSEVPNIQALGEHYGFHHLLTEDILNTNHRPKLEEFDNCIFITMKMLGINDEDHSIHSEQISFVLGKNWLISFQEVDGDVFNAFRTRLENTIAVTRKKGPDYLMYRLIDIIVDNYFSVIESLNEKIELLTDQVLSDESINVLPELQSIRKQLISLKKVSTPLRDLISNLQKESIPFISEHTYRFLGDVYDHVLQVNDNIDTQRELLNGLMDLYLSGVSNKMNQVMKVLTLVATTFIPLTFIVGIYGMNFDHIPELHWKFGYFGVWGIMIAVFVGMLFFFRRKKWL